MGLVGVEPRARLVGRGVELEVLRGVVEDAATGRARIVLLEGEAGIGKTRLIAEALAFAGSRGFRVFSGACDEVEQDSPLRALREALEVERGAPDPARAELARLLESDSPERDVHGAGTADEGWLIVEAVLSVLEQFASTAPIALAVEDLPEGWTFGAASVRNGWSRFTLDHDRAGSPALVVRLTGSCDVVGATPALADEPRTRRYERTEPGFSGPAAISYTVFPGGCVTTRFRFTGSPTHRSSTRLRPPSGSPPAMPSKLHSTNARMDDFTPTREKRIDGCRAAGTPSWATTMSQ